MCLTPGAVGANRHAFEYVPGSVLHSVVEKTLLVQQFTHAYKEWATVRQSLGARRV